MSYRKIVSVVNDLTVSTVTSRYAISMAVACKAEIMLYAAHDVGESESSWHGTVRHLDHLTAIASEQGVPVTRIMENGNISTLLPKRVQAEQCDLVFYPLAPYKRYGADLQRRTIRSLMRAISPDLVIMRAVSMTKPHPRHILVPLGNVVNDVDRHVIFIAGMAEIFKAEVTLYHLFASQTAAPIPDGITLVRKLLEQHNITVRERSGFGVLSEVITVEAITRHNDLIILGASERGLLRRLFFGNPAADVMHQPPCNAILFRAGR